MCFLTMKNHAAPTGTFSRRRRVEIKQIVLLVALGGMSNFFEIYTVSCIEINK